MAKAGGLPARRLDGEGWRVAGAALGWRRMLGCRRGARMAKNLEEEDLKQKKIFIGVVILLAAIALCEGILLLTGVCTKADSAYIPSLQVVGDVENSATVTYSDGKYSVSIDGGEKISCKTMTFDSDGKTYKGVFLGDITGAVGLCTEKTHIYYCGYDDMLSSIDASTLADNYIVFTSNGWEAINLDYPPSSNVKGMEYIVAVADNPEDVENSVTVTDDSGYERILSPGTLFITDTTYTRKYHGQSEKGGKQVTVFTTDKFVEIGGKRLVLDGNKITDLDEANAEADEETNAEVK